MATTACNSPRKSRARGVDFSRLQPHILHPRSAPVSRNDSSGSLRDRAPALTPLVVPPPAVKRRHPAAAAEQQAPRRGSKDDYKDFRVIGKGSFSIVYAATYRLTNAQVALKRIDIANISERERQDYLREIELLKKLNHPNIIKYVDSFVEGDFLFIAMEMAKIGDMSLLIRKGKEKGTRLPEKTIWKLFYQFSNAIKHMHECRVMHRDIKPANVFIDEGGKVQLGDLGLSRSLSTVTSNAHSIVGTPYYMAPERIREESYSFKSDIWSMGCVLYEMAMLQSPFYMKDANLVTLAAKIQNCDYPPVTEEYSPALRQLVSMILVPDPAMRPDAGEVHAYVKAQIDIIMDRPAETA